MATDTEYMKKVLELAARGLGSTFPNPLVGAVIVQGSEIVGEGYHRGPGNPHAEIEAIRVAGDRTRGATLYLNLEPCCHFGQTPPCTDAIREAELSKVVFSHYDPDSRVCGRGSRALEKAGMEVRSGLSAAEALELNLPYVHWSITGRTFVVLKLASTLDGRLTAPAMKYLTGEGARRHVHKLRAWTQAIAVGIGTIEKDKPALDRRMLGTEMPAPIRMVFDSHVRFPVDHPWLEAQENTIVYCSERADRDRKTRLEDAGCVVVRLPGKNGALDLSRWIDDTSARGIASVLVEGGGQISTTLIREGLFDRFVLFYAAVISGEQEVSWFHDQESPEWLCRGDLVLTAAEQFGNDVMAIYDRARITEYLARVTEGAGSCLQD